jgi:hypothetical protein
MLQNIDGFTTHTLEVVSSNPIAPKILFFLCKELWESFFFLVHAFHSIVTVMAEKSISKSSMPSQQTGKTVFVS